MPNIVVPELGESVVEARVAKWLKQVGDQVAAGEPLVELETEKIDLEVSADRAGVLASIAHQEGADVRSARCWPCSTRRRPRHRRHLRQPRLWHLRHLRLRSLLHLRHLRPLRPLRRQRRLPHRRPGQRRRPATSPGRTTSGSNRWRQRPARHQGRRAGAARRRTGGPAAPAAAARPASRPGDRTETRERMSKRRATIARRLVEAQRTAAMLTTFNEVDMTAVMELRGRRKEAFQKAHGVGLGIASFFVKAAIGALKAFPAINAEMQGDEVVYKHYFDIGMAVGAEGGLVVPVLRDADQMSFAGVELAIRDFAKRAGDGTLTLEDLKGGTFTITNGGVFGSLMSTPILNPPQVGILGLHKIADRPTVVGGQVVVRPMMYLALSYDHRLVDGREAVQFLVKVKEYIEDPAFLLVEG